VSVSTATERLQRRTVRVLVAAQVLAGFGTSAAAGGALLALELTGREALASLPLALLVVGSSAVVLPVSALSRRAGRRVGLTAALALGAAGALGTVGASATGSFPGLLAASALFGAGNAAVMLARYAAADLAPADERGRAIGVVVLATAVGAVAGPNLLGPAGRLAAPLGLPAPAGLYLLAAAAFALAATLLLALLRPDPLHEAIRLAPAPAGEPGQAPGLAPARPGEPGLALRALAASPGAAAGLATMVTANFVMVAVMAMAPVQMAGHGENLRIVGLVVSLHVAGMFAPAPLTGRLTDRLGALWVAGAGTALLVVAGALSALAGGLVPFALGLVLLGLGWNAALIAGSTLLASAVEVAQRPRAEALGELGMGVTAASATAVAGPIVGLAGYATLALLGALAAAALAPLLLLAGRRGAPDRAAPAQRAIA